MTKREERELARYEHRVETAPYERALAFMVLLAGLAVVIGLNL